MEIAQKFIFAENVKEILGKVKVMLKKKLINATNQKQRFRQWNLSYLENIKCQNCVSWRNHTVLIGAKNSSMGLNLTVLT